MNSAATIVVTERPLRPEELLDIVSSPAHGAQALFLGVIRNDDHAGKTVRAITYDAFTPLAEKTLGDIANEAAKKFTARVAAAQRVGRLEVGEASIAIAAGCAHRAQAFDACRYVIDEVKRRLPVWKKEHYADGQARWLDGCALAK